MPEVLVTPHARNAYRERVCSLIGAGAVEAEIREALQRPLFACVSADGCLTLWGCRNRRGFLFLAATDPADEGAPFLLVRTVGQTWFWHEARHAWHSLGVDPHKPRRDPGRNLCPTTT